MTVTTRKILEALARVGRSVQPRSEADPDREHDGLWATIAEDVSVVRFDVPQCGVGRYVLIDASDMDAPILGAGSCMTQLGRNAMALLTN